MQKENIDFKYVGLVITISSVLILILNIFFGLNALILNNIILIALTYFYYLWLGSINSDVMDHQPPKKKLDLASVLNQNPIRSMILIILIIMFMALFSLIIPVYFVGTFLFGFIAIGIIIIDYFKNKKLNLHQIIFSFIIFGLWVGFDVIYATIVYGQVLLPENVVINDFVVFVSFFGALYFCVIYSGILMIRKSTRFNFFLSERNFKKSIESLVLGLILGFPWAVASILNHNFLNQSAKYYWWEPLMVVLPKNTGVLDLHETIWSLLFLLPLSYSVLKSNFSERDSIMGAVIFISIFTVIFRYPVLFWINSFFYIFLFSFSYGIPQSFLFVKKGFDLVVGFVLISYILPIVLIILNFI
ncbi:MAG: hypothetical protein ACTSW1_04010 [Candidatus Hodarchaeales archaeon]